MQVFDKAVIIGIILIYSLCYFLFSQLLFLLHWLSHLSFSPSLIDFFYQLAIVPVFMFICFISLKTATLPPCKFYISSTLRLGLHSLPRRPLYLPPTNTLFPSAPQEPWNALRERESSEGAERPSWALHPSLPWTLSQAGGEEGEWGTSVCVYVQRCMQLVSDLLKVNIWLPVLGILEFQAI